MIRRNMERMIEWSRSRSLRFKSLLINTEMSVLVWSTLLYLVGVAVLLLLRPGLMFRQDGTWKEFGLQNDEHTTLFPFWMFCIAWAVGSYFIIRVGFSQESLAATAAAATATQRTILRVPESVEAYEEAAESLMPLPPPSKKKRGGAETPAEQVGGGGAGRGAPMPGYYMMRGGRKGVSNSSAYPQYIYIGPDMPGEEEDT